MILIRQIEYLQGLFRDLAANGDVSMSMNTERGGVFIQVSRRDWEEDEFRFIVANNTSHRHFVIEDNGQYGWIVRTR